MTARPRRAPQQTRSRLLVARLLHAAAELFAERGYAATTTNHVAERAGVSVGSLYQFFPDKAALLAALQAQWTGRLRRALDDALMDARRPLAGVIDDVLHVHATLNADPPGLLGLLLVTPSAAGDHETVRAAVQARLEDILALRAPGLEAGERVAVARMTIHIANGLYALDGAPHTGTPGVTDPAVRAQVRAALLAYLGPLVEPGTDREGTLSGPRSSRTAG